MQTVSPQFTAESGNGGLHWPTYGIQVSWTKQINSDYSFFTIGESVIGGSDIIPSSSMSATSFLQQYQYTDYTSVTQSWSVSRNIGQYPYGAFGAQGSIVLNNTSLEFTPGYDSIIGSYITYGRPIMIATGFQVYNSPSPNPNPFTDPPVSFSETINLFAGLATQPQNDIANRQITLSAFDGFDYLENFTSKAQGPLALELNGAYYQAQTTITSASNGQSLPQSTINVDSTVGFPPSGTALVITTYGYQTVTYMNTTGTALTGCSGGSGTMVTGNSVSASPIYAQQIMGDLLQEAGFSPDQYVLEQSLQGPIGYFSPYNLQIGDIMQAFCEAEQGLFFFDENGIARFWNRQHIADNNTPVWVISEDDCIQISPEETPILNDVQVQANPRAVQPRQQIWQQTSSTQIPNATNQTLLYNLSTNPSFENNITNWSTSGGTLTRITTDPYVGVACAQLVSTGSSQYMYNSITCAINTHYVAQCHVKGTIGAVVTIAAVENSVTLASATVTLDGNWDMLNLPSFLTDGTHTSFNLEIYPTTSQTIEVDAVMVSPTNNASSTYFDGETTYSSTYVYSWQGTANNSASTATPAGSVTIEADFQDNNGSVPVTYVTLPIYSTNVGTSLTSNYTANFADDGSGSDAGSYVYIAGTSLVNEPSDAASLTGSSYFITFVNTASQPVYITQLTLFGAPASVTYTINQEVTNQASIALYGDNPTNNGQPLLIQNDLIQNPDTANSDAWQIVNDFSVPFQRLTLECFPIPQLQIGDTVTVGMTDVIGNATYQPVGILSSITALAGLKPEATPMGILSSVTHSIPLPQYTDYTVVGITMSAGTTQKTDAQYSQQLELEVRQPVHYFTIGSSLIGGQDQIAP